MKTAQRVQTPQRVISVGGCGADIAGYDSNTMQLAADALKDSGGIIRLSEGTYDILGPVRLYSGTHLSGAGRLTVLKKSAGLSTEYDVDVDYGVFEATVKNPSGFVPGMGILISDSASAAGWSVSTSKVVGINGNTLHFDRRTLMDYSRENSGTLTNACSLIEIIKAENVKISGLSLDGSKETNHHMDGCRGGAVYIHKAVTCSLENVLVTDFNGDGISWQITEDITVNACEVYGCTGFGLHPGTGSSGTVVEACSLHHNGIDGMFVCWRVQYGVFRNNRFFNNGSSGISIGHRDTDNLFEGNRIYQNGKAGVTVRCEAPGNRADRNVYRGNVVEDNGSGDAGSGFLYESEVEGNVIEGNRILDNGSGIQKAGIACRACHPDMLLMKNNEIHGHIQGDTVII